MKQSRGIWITFTVVIIQIVLVWALAAVCFASVIYAQDFALNHKLIGMRYEREMSEINEINLFNYNVAHKKSLNKNLTPDTSVLPLSTNANVIYFHRGNSWLADIEQANSVIYGFMQGDSKLWKFEIFVTIRDGERDEDVSHMDAWSLSPNHVALAGTVFFPALIISLLLVFMYLARFALGGVRGAFMYFFDLATEYDPKQFMPATLVGITCGLFVIAIKCSWQILEFVHKI